MGKSHVHSLEIEEETAPPSPPPEPPEPPPPPLGETAEIFLEKFTVPTTNELATTSLDASSLWVIRSGGQEIQPSSSPAATSHRQTTAKYGAAADSSRRHQDLAQQMEGDRWRRGRIPPQSSKHGRWQKVLAEVCALEKKMVAGRAGRSTVTGRAAGRAQAATARASFDS
ncbi:hypothetical protein M9H77_25474 [Catharanthus roseus]|uniref:Uncharacterized protein n=1 Tax=Catharanthus roseus TaxID=4058 RepID=A0ACC0A7D6_CATRO|nr:hypothetical protein M9H77_25474 [Catharanthus roseus]